MGAGVRFATSITGHWTILTGLFLQTCRGFFKPPDDELLFAHATQKPSIGYATVPVIERHQHVAWPMFQTHWCRKFREDLSTPQLL